MSQVGRIGGHLLNPNLERRGVDLAFKNTAFNDPVIYLQVDPQLNTVINATDLQADTLYKIRSVGTSNFILIGATSNTPGTVFRAIGPTTGTGDAYVLDDDNDPNPTSGSGTRIGINTDTPVYDLDVISDASTTNLSIGNISYIDNITLSNTDTFSTVSGPINILPNQSNPLIRFDKLTSDNLVLNDNTIGSFSNSNVTLDTNGTGKLKIFSSTDITGNLYATGNITLDGNLSAAENIIVGDTPFDTVTVGTDFTQTLEPATDNTFDIGSADKRWANFWSDDWQTPDNLTITGMIISDQIRIDGTSGGEIFALQSNDGLELYPGGNIAYGANLSYTIDNPNAYSTPNSDFFGISSAISESYIIIGARAEDDAVGNNSGKAYIFDSSTGSLLHTLDNPNAYSTASADLFGDVVSISESYAIVGSFGEDDASGANSGKAYIFSTSTGALLHTLDNPSPNSFDEFGGAVSISESYAIVAAEDDDTDGSNSGRAYIFSTTTGALLHTLTNPNTSSPATDVFGTSVAITDTHAIVGARLYDVGGLQNGRAYVFNPLTGALLHTLENPNLYGNASSDNFGISVALSESYAIVGANFEDDDTGTSSGAAYIFDLSDGSVLNSLSNPNPNDNGTNDVFGQSVSITDNYAIVAAPTEDDAELGSGKVYVFDVTDGSLLATIDNPNAYETSLSDFFGWSVGISGNRVVVGAYGESEPGWSNSGTAYVFDINFSKTFIEDTQWETNNITNLLNTPLTFTSTGIGYLRFMGDNGVVIPAGGDASRPSSPETGDTRWNTDGELLECFDAVTGTYITSIGPGEVVTQEFVEELGNIYSLILG